ncbi:hypothetical protein WA158_005746 [Blastocystis sp. Blastoise]
MESNYFAVIDGLVNNARFEYQNDNIQSSLESYKNVIQYIDSLYSTIDDNSKTLLQTLRSTYVFEMNFVDEIAKKKYEAEKYSIESPQVIDDKSIVPQLKGYGCFMLRNRPMLRGNRTFSTKVIDNYDHFIQVTKRRMSSVMNRNNNEKNNKKIDELQFQNKKIYVEQAMNSSQSFVHSVKKSLKSKSKMTPHSVTSKDFDVSFDSIYKPISLEFSPKSVISDISSSSIEYFELSPTVNLSSEL